MKADHNSNGYIANSKKTVSNGSKILKWKQTTTSILILPGILLLFPMVQRYLNESRPQLTIINSLSVFTVSNGSKILKWKQTTTLMRIWQNSTSLFPMVQRYLNESRPQLSATRYNLYDTVSNGSKILKWKQTTT